MHIPNYLDNWFQQKGWSLHVYQRQMFDHYAAGQSTLLIAPTGGGKTLASFLPGLIDIVVRNAIGLQILYISPLKALTTDIQRNLLAPINEMQLKVTVETRTGDTSSYRRLRQRKKPPHILLTTPESLMLLLSYPDAAEYFKGLKLVIVDELHNFATTKRGDLLALGLAKLSAYAPLSIRFGLSATIADPESYAAWLGKNIQPAKLLIATSKQKPTVSILTDGTKIPYSGFMAKYAVTEIYETIQKNNMTIIYVNTRAQTEFIFRQLWHINDKNLPIAIYHGSLEKSQRTKTENLTVAGLLKAVVPLALGIHTLRRGFG
jgi:ATP-dependent Lhr-like helicase